jgi:hypothetical protein
MDQCDIFHHEPNQIVASGRKMVRFFCAFVKKGKNGNKRMDEVDIIATKVLSLRKYPVLVIDRKSANYRINLLKGHYIQIL